MNYSDIDDAIITGIGRIRSQHHACTARHLSVQLNVSRNIIRERLTRLKNEGVVTWTDVAGSLRVVGTRDAKPPVDETPTASSPASTASESTPPVGDRPAGAAKAEAVAKKKAAAKKRPAKKKAAARAK